ncbi:tetratricopeptide repeat protein [bacterium]|nr:tetratricopeptide repeat protein [bacterium]
MPDLQDDIESKISELSTLVETSPSPQIFAQLADLLRTTNRLAEARQICERGLGMFPDDKDCLMCYARILMDSGEFEEAKSVLEKLKKSGNEDVGVLLLLGQLFAQSNDFSGIYFVAKKLAENYPDDIRAKKFLQFLDSRGLLKGIELTGKAPEKSEVAPSVPQSQTAQITAPEQRQQPSRQVRPAPPPEPAFPPVPLEDLMHIAALLKGIVGVNYVVILTADNKTLASKGCPENVARPVGGMLHTLKKALRVAFSSLEFGRWTKGVVEFSDSVIHIVERNGYYFALVCDPSMSMGALRLAVNAVLSKYFD